MALFAGEFFADFGFRLLEGRQLPVAAFREVNQVQRPGRGDRTGYLAPQLEAEHGLGHTFGIASARLVFDEIVAQPSIHELPWVI